MKNNAFNGELNLFNNKDCVENCLVVLIPNNIRDEKYLFVPELPASVEEIIIFGNFNIKEIEFEKKGLENVKSISLIAVNIEEIGFLKNFDKNKLEEIKLIDNKISLKQSDILRIINHFPNIKKFEFSNSVLEEWGNSITDFDSQTRMPSIFTTENCYKDKLKVDRNKRETELKPRKIFLKLANKEKRWTIREDQVERIFNSQDEDFQGENDFDFNNKKKSEFGENTADKVEEVNNDKSYLNKETKIIVSFLCLLSAASIFNLIKLLELLSYSSKLKKIIFEKTIADSEENLSK